MSSGSAAPVRENHIDGLRAVAVLLVLSFHGGIPPFKGGFVGVDLFFVISGYLITGQLQREFARTGRIDLATFYLRRVRRLLPALILVILATLIAGAMLFSPAHFFDEGVSALCATAGVSNFCFWHQSGYFDISSDFKPLLHTWSLGVEQQFYLVWPILTIASASLSKWRSWVTIAVLFLVCGFSLRLNIVYQNETASIFFLPWFRAFEFGIGAICAQITRATTYSGPKTRLAATALGLILIGSAALLFDQGTIFPSLNALIPCLGAALLIWSGQAGLGAVPLRSPWLATLGRWSYSIYLVHWPIIVFYRYAKFAPITWKEGIVLCFISMGLAGLVYHFVERPFMERQHSNYVSTCALAKYAAGFVPIILAGGILAWATDGLPQRLPGGIAAYPRLAELGEVAFRVAEYGGYGINSEDRLGGGDQGVLLAGDSHARQYFAGLNAMLPTEDHAYLVMDKGSCLFRETRCDSYDDTIRDFVQEFPKALIVLSQRWDFYKHIALHFGTAAIGRVGPNALALFYKERIEALFGLYGFSDDQRIVIMGAVPEVATLGDTATCLLRPAIFVRQDCTAAPLGEPGTAYRRQFNLALAQAIAALNGRHGWKITFIDPYEDLCSNISCTQISGGQILYNDHDHLSIAGSIRIVAENAAAFVLSGR